MRSASAICSPTRRSGLRLVIGSWKIMAMRLPRMDRIAFSSSVARSCPSNRIEPPTMRATFSGRSRMTDNAVTLLPQPDSPTMPSVSPAATSKLTPSTARVTPSALKKCVLRLRTLRSFSLTSLSQASREARVEVVAQAVTHEVDGEHHEREREPRREDRPGRAGEVESRGGDHIAPARNLGRRARAEKGERRFDQNGGGADIGRLHDERRDRRGQDVA